MAERMWYVEQWSQTGHRADNYGTLFDFASVCEALMATIRAGKIFRVIAPLSATRAELDALVGMGARAF